MPFAPNDSPVTCALNYSPVQNYRRIAELARPTLLLDLSAPANGSSFGPLGAAWHPGSRPCRIRAAHRDGSPCPGNEARNKRQQLQLGHQVHRISPIPSG